MDDLNSVNQKADIRAVALCLSDSDHDWLKRKLSKPHAPSVRLRAQHVEVDISDLDLAKPADGPDYAHCI